MKNIPLLLGTLVVSIAMIGAIIWLFPSSSTSSQALETDPNLLIEGATKVFGPDSAPVTIVEFSDFQCPACKASEPFVKAVLTQYPDSVRLVFRHYPLDQIHQYARTAATAAEVANEAGKFQEFAELLFARQDAWSNLDSFDLVKSTLTEYATELGIDTDGFIERMDSEDIMVAVQKDVNLGSSLNITGTPTFFVNGTQTTAPELLDVVKQVLESQPAE